MLPHPQGDTLAQGHMQGRSTGEKELKALSEEHQDQIPSVAVTEFPWQSGALNAEEGYCQAQAVKFEKAQRSWRQTASTAWDAEANNEPQYEDRRCSRTVPKEVQFEQEEPSENVWTVLHWGHLHSWQAPEQAGTKDQHVPPRFPRFLPPPGPTRETQCQPRLQLGGARSRVGRGGGVPERWSRPFATRDPSGPAPVRPALWVSHRPPSAAISRSSPGAPGQCGRVACGLPWGSVLIWPPGRAECTDWAAADGVIQTASSVAGRGTLCAGVRLPGNEPSPLPFAGGASASARRGAPAQVSLIQEMNSDDPLVQQKAILETEKRLLFAEDVQDEDGCKTTLNKTLISPPQASAKTFLASVEKDAKERARRRRENKILADALKEKGNDAFVKGDYEAAIQCYSEGLEKLKDMKVLYTNRAQAYIKVGDYQKALVDCDWALKSRECFQKILEISPKLQTQVKDYLNQVDLREKADLQEKEARELLESGKNTAVTTKNLLESLSKPDQNPLFYAGGIEILTEMMEDCTERTLFRTHSGFSIISENELIRRCFSTGGKDAVDETVCVSVLRLWQAVCKENEENQRLLVMHPDMGRLLPSLLACGVLTIRQQSLALLLQLAQTENGRGLIISHLDLTQLLEALVSFLDFSDKKANSAMELLTDLALEKRFQVWFQANLPDVLPVFTDVLKRDPKVTRSSAFCQFLAIVGNLSAEAAARQQMATSEEFGSACLSLLARCEEDVDLFREVIYALLGLMMNLCLQSTFVSEVWAAEASRRCMSLLNSQDGGILTRAAGVLSRTLPSSLKIIEEALRAGVVKKMVKFLKTGGQTASRYAVKTLAVCTNSFHEAREEVVRLDKKFSILMKLLSSEDEILVGNAALCLGNCVEVPQASATLLNTDIVQVLLKQAGSDSQRTAVQLNAGIALGKLCTVEPRFADQLRQLHGLEILNSTTKYISDS
ncbi:Tetratricopeptide repeat protein 12 [Galemys pyrenaicus]|uniref:Tetratricopeptide repeat protein 12 n=1 Tax=Galemys pyrenaicus TaxID=202257 RepID=A0A8J6B267_GALPY|nr:Tetratricopeptide repeat protein 12 [Galemys pyrenaicus]